VISRGRKESVVYYALGGGLGHLTRSLALGRTLQRRGQGLVVALTNSPHADLYAREELAARRLTPTDGASPAALAAWVQRALDEERPRLFIVDAFPRGLLGELPELLAARRGPAALILRRLREEYVREYDLPEFIRAHYDWVLLVEKGLDEWRFALGDLAQEVPPILIRSAEELLPPEEARARLRCSDDGPVVLGVGAGDAQQVQRFLALLVKVWTRCGLTGHLRLATAQTWPAGSWEPGRSRDFCTPETDLPSGPWDPFLINYYPLFELFRGVSLVVGACGYNLFHETQAAGVPALFLPQRRLYDDQFARATSAVVAHDPHQLEHFLRTALTDPATRPAPSFVNGAEVAADGLMRCAAA
jgi:hypothetical protein